MKNFLLLLTLSLGLIFTSCSKDDEPAPQTKTEMLTGKNWKVTAATVSIDNGPAKDFSGQNPACGKDDFETYATDGKYTIDLGTTKCASNEAQTQTGSWTFTEGEAKLKVTVNNSTTEYTLTELTASTLALTISQTFTNSGKTTTYTYVTTYGVQ